MIVSLFKLEQRSQDNGCSITPPFARNIQYYFSNNDEEKNILYANV